jgi:MFS family permease
MAKKISPEIAARWTALYYLGITFGRFVSGFVTMKLHSRQMVRLGQVIIGCGIIVLVLPVGNNALLSGFFMTGLGCAPIYPSLLHETPENFGKEHSQAIMGIQMAGAYIGTTLMPPVFGQLAAYISFNIFPVFIGIVLILKILMVEIVNRKIDKMKNSGASP